MDSRSQLPKKRSQHGDVACWWWVCGGVHVRGVCGVCVVDDVCVHVQGVRCVCASGDRQLRRSFQDSHFHFEFQQIAHRACGMILICTTNPNDLSTIDMKCSIPQDFHRCVS